MGFLAKLLGSVGTGGIWVYLAIGVAVFAAGGLSGAKVQRMVDAPTIAQLHTDVATEQGRTKDAQAALLAQQRQTALDIAEANASALAQRQTLDAKADELNAKLATTERARQAASTKLLDTLKAIPHDQQAPLPASVRAYLRELRLQQAAGADPTTPPDSH